MHAHTATGRCLVRRGRHHYIHGTSPLGCRPHAPAICICMRTPRPVSAIPNRKLKSAKKSQSASKPGGLRYTYSCTYRWPRFVSAAAHCAHWPARSRRTPRMAWHGMA
ncbi:hypothetical protein DENSPDRAFT_254841 [Dentipellis sp. KUC8613]|nr:hypothetical protein DENSPDRAFT_254841 [Dentipellis sp. KUC8613]